MGRYIEKPTAFEAFQLTTKNIKSRYGWPKWAKEVWSESAPDDEGPRKIYPEKHHNGYMKNYRWVKTGECILTGKLKISRPFPYAGMPDFVVDVGDYIIKKPDNKIVGISKDNFESKYTRIGTH